MRTNKWPPDGVTNEIPRGGMGGSTSPTSPTSPTLEGCSLIDELERLKSKIDEVYGEVKAVELRSKFKDSVPTNSPQTGTIGWAILQLKNGARVFRNGWNGNGQFLKIWDMCDLPRTSADMSLPFIFITTVVGNRIPWTASQTDLLAEDWMASLE